MLSWKTSCRDSTFLAVIAVLFVSGCAQRTGQPESWPATDGSGTITGSQVPVGDANAGSPPAAESESASRDAASTQAAEELYEDLALQTALYQEGVGLLREGEESAGEEQIRDSMNRIASGFEACGRIDGCDINRFYFTFNQLLEEQNLALKVQAVQISEMRVLSDNDMDREAGTTPFLAEITESEAHPAGGHSVSLLRGSNFRDSILLNEPVQAAMDDWLTWLRPLLLEAYENYFFLREEIFPLYDEAGLPEALLFGMIATETGGKVHAFSRAGAAGLLQFIRATGRRYGLTEQDGFDLRLDPVESTRANVAYLNELFEMLDGDLEKSLAAYNGGENRIRRLNRQLGTPSFWDKRFYYSLPAETREYVPKILAAAWLFLHPDDYSLQFPQHETDLQWLTVERETSLGELTICLGQELNARGWFRTLRNVNPRLDPGEEISVGTTVRIPKMLEPAYRDHCLQNEPLLARARQLHQSNYQQEPDMIPYVVQRGDTLGKIAGRYSCISVSELAAINRVRPPSYVISVGQTLKIPGCG